MKYLTILFISILAIGCELTDHNEFVNQTNKKQIERLFYYKDSKTNLCFATLYLGNSESSFSQVPCTPEVEAIIANKNCK